MPSFFTEKKRTLIILANLFLLGTIVFSCFFLDLLKENYSTLTLRTEGYLLLLIMGIIAGTVSYAETKAIDPASSKKILFFFILMTLCPNKGYLKDLHLIFAYLGYFMISIITIFNCLRFRRVYVREGKFITSVLAWAKFFEIFAFMFKMFVSTLAEIIFLVSVMFSNLAMYLTVTKKEECR